MIPMKENQASALTIVADRPTKRRAIGQKVLIKIAIHIDNSMSVAI